MKSLIRLSSKFLGGCDLLLLELQEALIVVFL